MEKLKLKTKILYGLGGVGDSALYNLMGNFALFFLTTIAGINPAIAGTITAIGSLCDTVCGAVMGYVSDHTNTRFGKRKPFVLAASIPLMVFTALFFLHINAGQGLMTLYYGIVLILFWSSFSIFFVPYLAWGAELTNVYDERTSLRGYVYCFNTLGTAIGLVLPNIMVDFLEKGGCSLEISWQITGTVCGVLSGGTILICAVGIKDKFQLSYDKSQAEASKQEKKKEKASLKARLLVIADMLRNYIQILKLRTVRYILGASVFYLIGYTIFCSDRMYFFTYNMGLPRTTITVVMMVLTFASVAFVPLISMANKWADKRTSYLVGMIVCSAGMAAYCFIGVSSMLHICVFAVLYCIGNLVYWQLIPAMIYDVCEVDQLINNKERAGLVISLQALSESLSTAAGLQLMGLILNFAGFDGTQQIQTETAMRWTGYSFSLIPAIFMALSAFCIFKYPVTKKVYNQVLAGLKRRAEGKPVDLDEFKKLK